MDININKNMQGNIAFEYSPVSSPRNMLHNAMKCQCNKKPHSTSRKNPPIYKYVIVMGNVSKVCCVTTVCNAIV